MSELLTTHQAADFLAQRYARDKRNRGMSYESIRQAILKNKLTAIPVESGGRIICYQITESDLVEWYEEPRKLAREMDTP